VKQPPYLTRISVVDEQVGSFEDFPYSLPFVRGFDLAFKRPVTFLVGENGSGKSTVMEALAEICGLPVSGGGTNDSAGAHGPEGESALGSVLRPSFKKRPKDSYFFRGEFQTYFAELLDRRRKDRYFSGDPYARYGGRSLNALSHGEAFLEVILNRMEKGLFLMDEPESALSPQRQLALLARMSQLRPRGRDAVHLRDPFAGAPHVPRGGDRQHGRGSADARRPRRHLALPDHERHPRRA
jgi:predicted ATPase